MATERTKEILEKAQNGELRKDEAMRELKKESVNALMSALSSAIETGTLKVIEDNHVSRHMSATASIATPETDARIAARERQKGAQAKREGKTQEDCPWSPNSLVGQWWLEGFDNPYAGKIGIPLSADEQN